MAGEATLLKTSAGDKARRLAAFLATCERWRRAGFVAFAAAVTAAACAMVLSAMAFAAAMGKLYGLAGLVEMLLAAPLAVAAAGLVSLVLPASLLRIARIVQREAGRRGDVMITAAEVLTGRVYGAPAFLNAVVDRALAESEQIKPGRFFWLAPWQLVPPAAGAAAIVFAMTLLVPGAWQRLVRKPGITAALPAPKLPSPRPAPIPPPALQSFSLQIDSPPYTGLPSQTLTAPASISAPIGSRIVIEARFSNCRELLYSWGQQHKRASGDRLRDERTLIQLVRWSLTGRGPGGEKTLGPFAITPIPDRPPTAQILQPAAGLRISAPQPISLQLAASDDYGLSRVALQYKTAAEKKWHEIPLEGAGGKTFRATTALDLRPMGLEAGDVVLLRLAATDNNAVAGPATAYSPVRRITIAPDLRRARQKPVAEIQEMAAREEDAFSRLQRDLEDLRVQLDRLQQSLGSPGQPSASDRGERQAELSDLAARLKRSAEGIKKALSDVERRLKLEKIVDEEVLQKVAELHRLANEVLDKQMKELLDRLQKALNAADVEKLRADIDQLKRLRDRFVEQLNRTLELLKRARMEMMLEALARKLKQMADEQENLAERTAKLKDRDPSARAEAQRQAELARQAAPLPEEIQHAAEQASQADKQTAAQLQALAERLRRQDPAGDMRQATSALERLAPSQALDPQQRALQTLRQAAAQLRGVQANMLAQRRRQLQAQANRAVTEALALAQSQRQLMRQTRQMAAESLLQALRNKRQLEEAAARQRAIAQGAEKLTERLRKLAGQTPVVQPELAARTQAVAEALKEAARQLQGGEAMAARMAQLQALAQLNQLAADLVDLSSALGKESAQMALSEYLKRLEQLAEQQRALNQQAQQAGAGNPMLSELAAQQMMLKAALQKLMRGAGRQLSDKLGGVPQNMEDVAKDLRARRLTKKTKTKQHDILRKMLDAQRSLYTKRQRSRQRVAERPKPYKPAPSPPALKNSGPPRLKLPENAESSPLPVPEEYQGLAEAYQRRIAGGRQ